MQLTDTLSKTEKGGGSFSRFMFLNKKGMGQSYKGLTIIWISN